MYNGTDSGFAGLTVYLDTNNNGQFDLGEPTMTTASDGTYSFTGLSSGLSGTVRLTNPPSSGFVQVPTTSTAAFTTSANSAQPR